MCYHLNRLCRPFTSRRSSRRVNDDICLGTSKTQQMIRYEEDQDRYIAGDKYVIRRRVIGEHEEWQIKHLSSLTWTSADTILEMAEAVRQAQQHHTERRTKETET